jgi:hypothetical protein
LGLFGRKKGRHALGAAVTSIPAGPPPALFPTAYEAPAPVAEQIADPVTVPAAPATTAGVVADLLLTGEWAAAPAFAPVAAPVEIAPEPTTARVPVQHAPEPVTVRSDRPPPATAPLVAATPRPAPTPLPAAPALQVPTPPRVQLGFRDGTSTTLAADSEQAVALELLAQLLTRRD